MILCCRYTWCPKCPGMCVNNLTKCEQFQRKRQQLTPSRCTLLSFAWKTGNERRCLVVLGSLGTELLASSPKHPPWYVMDARWICWRDPVTTQPLTLWQIMTCMQDTFNLAFKTGKVWFSRFAQGWAVLNQIWIKTFYIFLKHMNFVDFQWSPEFVFHWKNSEANSS